MKLAPILRKGFPVQNPKPELTPLALSDLDALFDAVLDTSESVATAEGIYRGVLEAIENVATFPSAAPSVRGKLGIACDYRWVEHKGWLAFYHIKPNGGILVDRVLWGRSEWTKALGLLS